VRSRRLTKNLGVMEFDGWIGSERLLTFPGRVMNGVIYRQLWLRLRYLRLDMMTFNSKSSNGEARLHRFTYDYLPYDRHKRSSRCKYTAVGPRKVRWPSCILIAPRCKKEVVEVDRKPIDRPTSPAHLSELEQGAPIRVDKGNSLTYRTWIVCFDTPLC
jgi:hypothetical protein